MTRTDPKQAYADVFRDGYRRAKAELQDETDKAIGRLEAKTAELDAEAHAVRTALARLHTLDSDVEAERDENTRLN